MKKVHFVLSLLVVCFILTRCNKEKSLSEELLEQLDFISSDSFYETDITEAFGYGSEVNGVWEARFGSGGISGGGYTPNFDYLLIKPNGIFGVIHDDVLEAYGRINAEECDRPNSCIDFIAGFTLTGFQNHILGSVHQVRLENDTLSILTMDADGLETHLVRVE